VGGSEQEKVDKRRSRYVPVDVFVAFSPFGAKLNDRWGMEGLAAWMLLLAAAKREPVQGTFTFTSEAEAWTKIGATAASFSFDEFLTFCGRAKQTRKTRSGRITYVEITGWKRWNDDWKRETQSRQKSRKRAQNTETMDGRYGDDTGTEGESEAESEYEGEAEHPGLPISAEKLLELERIHDDCRDTDGQSLAALKAAARGVSYAGVVRVRESVQKRRGRVGVGYAVNALKSEAKEAA